jgi:hypothetical protein
MHELAGMALQKPEIKQVQCISSPGWHCTPRNQASALSKCEEEKTVQISITQ